MVFSKNPHFYAVPQNELLLHARLPVGKDAGADKNNIVP